MVGLHRSVDENLSQHQQAVKDKGTWPAAAHGVTESQTRLGD